MDYVHSVAATITIILLSMHFKNEETEALESLHSSFKEQTL